MLKKLEEILKERLKDLSFDTAAVSIIDFQKKSFETAQVSYDEFLDSTSPIYFDLASVTKALTNGTARLLVPDLFDEQMDLVLNHSGGLVWWGKLSRETWRDQVSSYPIKKSETVYSDFSALRTMLLLEKKAGKSIYDIAGEVHDKEVVHWTELPFPCQTPITGWRRHKRIRGAVNDDNAFVIKDKISHAGLFGTIEGVSKTMLNLESKVGLCDLMAKTSKKISPRFLNGWDTVTDPENTLAGKGASLKTFGHLGFTGTCIWVDPEKKVGFSLLTNGTKEYWYQKEGLNALRREIGSTIWSQS